MNITLSQPQINFCYYMFALACESSDVSFALKNVFDKYMNSCKPFDEFLLECNDLKNIFSLYKS